MQPHTESRTSLRIVAASISNFNTGSIIKLLFIATLVTLEKFKNYHVTLETISKLMRP